jgi:sugar/nucleoside kinase (ribokinase family)
MAKIGLNAAIIGKIGNDGFGAFMQNAFQENKVNTEGLIVKNGGSTSASLVIVTDDGERSFIHCQGENATLVESDIDYSILDEAKIVFVAGIMLMARFDGDECAKLLKKCKEKGKITALDTAWDSTGRWMKVMTSSMPYLDYFLPSYEEAVELSGKTEPEDIADVFLSMGPKTVVIKLGKDGCFIKTINGDKYSIPTYDKIKPVDTTGAGDSFCAGFLTGIVKGKSLVESGKFANAVGTHCIMAKGASTGIKSEQEIIKFMQEYESSNKI